MIRRGGVTVSSEILCQSCADVRGVNTHDPAQFDVMRDLSAYCERCGVAVVGEVVTYVEVCESCGSKTRHHKGEGNE